MLLKPKNNAVVVTTSPEDPIRSDRQRVEAHGIQPECEADQLGDEQPQALVGGGRGRGCGAGVRMGLTLLKAMASSDPGLQRLRQEAGRVPLRSRIIRAVASSTAIETGQSIAVIEGQLASRRTPS